MSISRFLSGAHALTAGAEAITVRDPITVQAPSRRAVLLGGLAPILSIAAPREAPAVAATMQPVTDIESYRQTLTQLASAYRFALIDIRADWCAVCHRIEREILAHPSVQRHLQHVALVKVDVTAMDEGNRQLLSHLRASGPPTFFIIDTATGGEFRGTRSVGSFRRNDLVRRLRPFTRLG